MKSIIIVAALTLALNTLSQNLLNGPDDIVFDIKYNRYLIGNWAGNRIISVDSNGNQTVFKTDLPFCHGMELFGDTLYAASADRIIGININNAQTIKNITVAGSSRLGHITLDTLNNFLYVSDWNINKVFKVNLNTGTPGTLVSSGIVTPVGILLDLTRNRIILLTFEANTPVKAVNLSNGQVTNITSAGYNNLDAITRDRYGYIYASSFTEGIVYRFDSIFSAPPEIISSGHNGPSGFGYNSRDHILGVTNYNSNSYSLVNLPVVSVKNISDGIRRFTLSQNYPNPFNTSTTFIFAVPKTSTVRLVIFDLLGREAAVLLNDQLRAGNYEITWDANVFSSGVYFYQLSSGSYTETKKLVLLK